MYNISYFKEKDKQVVLTFINKHPFAFLIGYSENSEPVATQIPMFIDEREGKLYLSGHIMRGTDHHKAFKKNQNVLAVFTGPHTYVSATWYDNPNQASTWNYMSVYIKGKIKFLDETGLIDNLRKTSLHFENYNSASPTVYDNLPEDCVNNLIKLSQNRNEESYRNIIKKLEEQGGDAKLISEEMKKKINELYESFLKIIPANFF